MLSITALLRPRRRRLAVALACGALVLSVAWAHQGPGMDHMALKDAVTLCVAVLQAAIGMGLAVGALRLVRLPRWSGALGAPRPVERSGCEQPPPRAGPAALALLQVFRR